MMLIMKVLALPALILVLPISHALDNGLALTPPMGFNSYMTDDLSGEAGLWEIAKFFVARNSNRTNNYSSMRDLGYVFINTDEGWELKARDNLTGQLQWSPEAYPSGLPNFIRRLHAHGLKYGIYGAASGVTCGEMPGQLYYEDMDARTYAEWGVDFLKSDNCASYALDSSVRFAAMRDALNRTGKPILLSIEPFSINPDPAQSIAVGNLWRVGTDIQGKYETIVNRADMSDKWAPLAGPGGFNDPDMINLQDPGKEGALSLGENRIYFGLWAIMKSPLLLSSNLPELKKLIDLVTNPEVIAINQDPLGYQARKIEVDGYALPWLVGLEDCNAAPAGQLQRHYRGGMASQVRDTRTWKVHYVPCSCAEKSFLLVNQAIGRCLTVLRTSSAPLLLPCIHHDEEASEDCSSSTKISQRWIFDKSVLTVTSITNVATGKTLAISNGTLYGSVHGSDRWNVSDAAYGHSGLVLVEPYDQDGCSNRNCQNYDPSQMWYYSSHDKLLRHALYTSSINHMGAEGEGYTLTNKMPTFRHHCLAHVLSTGNVGTTNGTLEVWGGVLAGGRDYVVGLVNRGQFAANITVSFASLLEGTSNPLAAGNTGSGHGYFVRDLWKRQDLGSFKDIFTDRIAGHDIGLYRLTERELVISTKV